MSQCLATFTLLCGIMDKFNNLPTIPHKLLYFYIFINYFLQRFCWKFTTYSYSINFHLQSLFMCAVCNSREVFFRKVFLSLSLLLLLLLFFFSFSSSRRVFVTQKPLLLPSVGLYSCQVCLNYWHSSVSFEWLSEICFLVVLTPFNDLLFPMRPKKVTHKSATLSIRLYPTEKIALKLLAKNCGLSLSDYLRKTGLDQKIKSRFTPEELSIYQMLVDYRNHFSRISNLIKDQLDFKKEVQLVIEKIDHHLNKIRQWISKVAPIWVRKF